MSVPALPARTRAAVSKDLEWALERIASRARELDREPGFPSENFNDLFRAGVLSRPAGDLSEEVVLVQRTLRAGR